MIVQILLVVVLYIVLKYVQHKRKFAKLLTAFPSNIWSLPLLGMSYHFIGSNEKRMKSLQLLGKEAVKNAGAAFSWLGPYPFLAVADAEVGEVILRTSLDKDNVMKLLSAVIGDGLIIAPLSIWRHRRKILIPTFTTKNLREHLKIFQKQSSVLMQRLRPNVGQKAFPIWNYLASNNLDTVCEAVFGIDLQSQKDPDLPFLNAFADIATILSQRLSQPWLHSDAIFKLTPQYQTFKKHIKTMYNIVDTVMENKRKEIDDPNYVSDKGIKPFLELLIESSMLENGIAKGAYSDEELREETMTLTIAGTDTSAAALAFVVLMLSKHQDIQDKVYKEIAEVWGDTSRILELEDIRRMEYTEMVIKESMRLYPAVPVILRQTNEDVSLNNGVVVPSGCHILMNIWALHRNPKYWGEDAEEFKPERFKDIVFKHPAQYMPFSYGPRNCPGARYGMIAMKTVLANLLSNYRLLPPEDDVPLRVSFEVMMKDVDNYRVRLDYRNRAM